MSNKLGFFPISDCTIEKNLTIWLLCRRGVILFFMFAGGFHSYSTPNVSSTRGLPRSAFPSIPIRRAALDKMTLITSPCLHAWYGVADRTTLNEWRTHKGRTEWRCQRMAGLPRIHGRHVSPSFSRPLLQVTRSIVM